MREEGGLQGILKEETRERDEGPGGRRERRKNAGVEEGKRREMSKGGVSENELVKVTNVISVCYKNSKKTRVFQ